MNKKLKTASLCFLVSTLSYSQVAISSMDNTNVSVHPNASLHVFGQQENGANDLGLVLPIVNKKSDLPLNNSNDVDPSMEGMILYTSETSTVNVYTGDYWEDDKASFINPTQNQSRFISAGDESDEQSVVCVLLVACGRHKILQFSHPIDGENSYNNLNITRSNTTFRYGAINYTDNNSKFTVTEAGTYQIQVNIPTYVAGVVSLTEGASYQIYAFKQDENGDHQEVLLSSVVPNFPGVLGIGGGGKVGVGITTTIALNPGDYVYTMIHSPAVTVSVGSELRAWDNSIFNPREIIFTKID